MNRPGAEASREQLLSGLPAVLTGVGILLLYAVPPSLLDLMRFGYGTPDGGAFGKVHPGTDLIVVAFAVAAARFGNPLRFFSSQARRFPCTITFLGVVAAVTAYLIVVLKTPFTPVIDTFVMPALLFMLLVDLPPAARVWIARGLHLFMAANAVVGIVEFLTDWRLFPLTLNGLEVTAEMEGRASGILGHPLASAASAGIYAVILALGFHRALPRALILPAVALQTLSLAAFGGRTALVMTSACLAVLAVGHLAQTLAGRRFPRRVLWIAFLVIVLGVIAAALLVSNGFFDLVLSRFVDDNGSAETRARMFNTFSYLSWQEILLGPDQSHLATVAHLEGLETAIESFWLGYILICGALMSALLFIGFSLFMAETLLVVDRLSLIPLVYFVVIISTTNSLAAKTVELGQYLAMVVVLMPPRLRTVPVRGSAALGRLARA